MSASPWARPDQSEPAMPEVVAAGERAEGLGRLRRYANLVKRSIHFKYTVARLLSRLLPDVRQRGRARPDVPLGRLRRRQWRFHHGQHAT